MKNLIMAMYDLGCRMLGCKGEYDDEQCRQESERTSEERGDISSIIIKESRKPRHDWTESPAAKTLRNYGKNSRQPTKAIINLEAVEEGK